MSFIFDGTGDNINGAFTTTRAQPVTLACWFKGAHPAAIDCYLALGNNAATDTDTLYLRTAGTANQYNAVSRGSAAGVEMASEVQSVGTAWTSLVGRFTSNTSREVFVNGITFTDLNVNSMVVAGVLKYIFSGTSPSGVNDAAVRIAELAIWDVALSDADVTSYLGGTAASGINASHLIGYWPLSTNSLTNLGTDAGGGLTATGNAVFDADHPSITSGNLILTPNTSGLSV